jgi:hypothetical protein
MDAFDDLVKPTTPTGGPDWIRAAVHRQPVALARNALVHVLLRYPEATHLFFLDDDTLPPADAVQRLLRHDVPIVSGFVVERAWPYNPSAYQHVKPDGTSGRYTSLTRFRPGLQTADAVGAACLLIRRDVFERMEPPWFDFRCGPELESSVGEDIAFCERARRLGYRIHLDFDVQCGHITRQVVGWRDCVTAHNGSTLPPTLETALVAAGAGASPTGATKAPTPPTTHTGTRPGTPNHHQQQHPHHQHERKRR